MCQVFGWAIDHVLSMTWPRFRCVAARLNEVVYCKARDEVFLGVVAALGNNNQRKNLFESCGGFFLNDKQKQEVANLDYTEEELEFARKRMKEIMEQQK
jgi:hypothetical protein